MGQLYLNKLQFTNFRNIDNSIVKFSKNINCIFGENGNGKTNLLEGIYYLVNHKSFRKNTSYPQIISVESEEPEILINTVLEDFSENLISYSGKITSDKSYWYLENQLSNKKLNLKTIFINPFDSYSFHTVSSARRTWVDTHLSYLSKDYKQVLNKYNTALRFRNNLLSKKTNNYLEQINVITEQLATYSVDIINRRKEFLNELKNYCAMTFKIIFNEQHNLELELDSQFGVFTKEQIISFYESSLEKDLILGHTRKGVHRDDYVFNFDGFNSFEYCSLGQQKMSFLSLLFAYIELFRYKFSSYPLVLIDDVSGELDERRWKNLIDYLRAKEFQVFITTANENFKKELEKIDGANKIFVSDGNLRSNI